MIWYEQQLLHNACRLLRRRNSIARHEPPLDLENITYEAALTHSSEIVRKAALMVREVLDLAKSIKELETRIAQTTKDPESLKQVRELRVRHKTVLAVLRPY